MPMSPRLLRPIASRITLPDDADALAYVLAVNAADGRPLEKPVVEAIDAFVIGCKSDGIWSAIKASCILMGARTLSGALTPLVGTAPTNNNFVSGDYNRKTGLVGDGSTKYLDTNRGNNADPQDDNHNAIYATTVGSSTALTVIGGTGQNGANHIGAVNFRNRNITAQSVNMQTGLNAHSRESSSEMQHRVGGVSSPYASTSEAPSNDNLALLRAGGSYGSHRIAFYSIGESLDLAALDARISALIAAIGAAI